MNKKLLVTCAVVFLFLAFKIYKSIDHPIKQLGTVKVAALLSLTGGASAWGENSKKGIELATSKLNAQGGIDGKQVEIIYLDTASDPKKSLSAYQEATSIERVTAVIGPLNQTEIASIIPTIEQTHTPTVIPGYIPIQNRKNLSNPLIVWMDAEDEAGQMAQYAYNQGIRTIAVIGTLDSWESTVSNAFAKKFKELGGTVTDQESVQPDSADMKLPVTRVIKTNPQAVFLGTYYQFVNSTKELHNLGYKGNLYSIEVDDYLASQTFNSSKGTQFIAPDFYTGTFTKDFNGKYGVKPGLPAGQSYDAANILFSFLEKTTKQSEILNLMKNTTQYEGVSGTFRISPDGRTSLPTAIFKIEDKGLITRVGSAI